MAPATQKINFFFHLFSAQSPIYSHTNATLQGLSTVRAFNAQHVLESEFYVHADYSTGAFHLKVITTRAFAFWLDVVCVLYIAFVTFSFVIIDDENGEYRELQWLCVRG